MTDHAHAYHDFRTKLSEEGYDELARDLYVLERKARTRAALPFQPITFLGGVLSGLLTGYGVRPRRVLLSSIVFLAATTLWFSQVGVVIGTWNTTYDLFGYEFETGAAYYSVVTFVTSPPHPPEHGGQFTRLVVTLETYLGTVLTVLLGYVLGNRSRI
ncbi:MAG: hypothetical protein ABEI99_07295 [Halobaculum sp.]